MRVGVLPDVLDFSGKVVVEIDRASDGWQAAEEMNVFPNVLVSL